jgi:polyisoprenoid-binding protein YceI
MTTKRLWVAGALLLSVLMSACGEVEKEQKEAVEEQELMQDESCLYSYDSDSSSVNWTAFKTTERAAVGGRFDSVVVSLPDTVYSPKEALEKASFRIISSSVFTENGIRDNTLRKYFFSTLKDNGNIEGKVKIVEGDNKSGGGTVMLMINGVKRDMGFKYNIVGNNIMLKTKINLNSFDGSEAVKSLNTQCDDLHKGADGVSKLWPDVEIEVKAALKKRC